MRNYLLPLALIAVLATRPHAALAQGRPLPVTEAPSSAWSLSLGGIHPNTHPQPLPGWVSYALALTPTAGPDYTHHFLSAGFRLTDSDALTADVSYQSMGTLQPLVDSQMQELDGERRHMAAYTAAAGYVRRLNRRVAAYAKVGYAAEHTVTTVSALHAALGATLSLRRTEATLSLTNLGRYTYTGHSGWLSPRLGLCGSTYAAAGTCSVGLHVDGGWFLKTADAPGAAELSGGLSVLLPVRAEQRLSLRIGGHSGDHRDLGTAGIGWQGRHLTVDAAVALGLRSDLNNTYMVGLGVKL